MKVKVVVVTEFSQIEKTVDTKAEAIQFKDSVAESRDIKFFSITEVQPIKLELPEGYH